MKRIKLCLLQTLFFVCVKARAHTSKAKKELFDALVRSQSLFRPAVGPIMQHVSSHTKELKTLALLRASGKSPLRY